MITKPKKRKVKSKKSNPSWIDKILGRKPTSRDSITVSVNDGDIVLSGSKFVELGKEFYDIIENKLKDLKIEFVPHTGKGKRYILNRTSVFDSRESDSDLEHVRRLIRRERKTP